MSSRKIGLAPGTAIFTGRQRIEHAQLTIYRYNADELQISNTLDDLVEPVSGEVLWIDVRGLHEVELVEKIGSRFNIHPLALEDIVDPYQRPKFDEYTNGYLIICKAYQFNAEERKVSREQVSVYCGENFVLSFQEDAKDIFEGVRKRIDVSHGRIRKRLVDYLSYALVDNVVDNYLLVLEQIGDAIEDLEGEITNDPSPESKTKIHQLKRCSLTLRRGMVPLREALGKFNRSEHKIITQATTVFIHDLYDHALLSQDINETYRDTLTGLQDLYLSEISYRMNQVMQVLTVIASIFIPLTFLAGIYGMNFKNMPELEWEHGYFYLLGLMVVIFVGLLVYFRRRRWL